MLTETLKDAAAAAVAAWPDDVPEKKPIATSIAAAVVPPPPPAFVRYPDADLVLSEREQLFGDQAGPLIGAVGGWQQQSILDNSVHPGNWVNMGNAPYSFDNVGGDYLDADGVKQGPKPFATIACVDMGSGVPAWFESTDLSAAVQGFIDGTYPNWGLALKNADNGAIICETLYSPNPPQLVLTVGGNAITLIPQAMAPIYGGNLTTLARQPKFQLAKYWLTYIYFDLTAYKGQTVTAAKLRIHSIDQFGNSVGQVFRARNAAMDTPRQPITYGIAANYPGDVGLESHPSVLMVQRVDPNFEDHWMNGYGVKYGTNNSMIERITDPAQMLAGKYPVLRCYHRAGSTQGAIERHSALWRGYNSLRLLAAPPPRVFMRYYVRFNNGQFGEPVWRPQPSGGKLPGLNGRFTAIGNSYVNPNTPVLVPTLPGAGLGNSGSTDSGMNGGSLRMNYDQLPLGSPLENIAGFGNTDCYNADISNSYGNFQRWNLGLGGHARLGEWACVELEGWMNTVTDPTQKGVRLASVINNGDGTATATVYPGWTLAGNPKYVTGQKWSIGGGLSLTDPANHGQVGQFNRVGVPITVLSDTQFSYPIPPNTGTHMIPGVAPTAPPGEPNACVWLMAVASQANHDGGWRGWVNGRLEGENTGVAWWHSAYLPDGVTPIGWDTVWWCVFQGGGASPTVDASLDLAQMVVATERIGPLVLTP